MVKKLNFLRPKPKKKEVKMVKTSFWYKLFLAVLIIATLWVALLWPEQISALFFEMNLIVLQFLHTPINFQMWWFIIFVFFVAWFGKYAFPSLDVLSADKSWIYYNTHEEGGLRYFKLIGGYQLVVAKDAVKRRGLRWITQYKLSCTYFGNTIVCQTEKMEVTTSLMWKREAESLMEENAKLRAEQERKETSVEFNQLIELEKARHGGEKQ